MRICHVFSSYFCVFLEGMSGSIWSLGTCKACVTLSLHCWLSSMMRVWLIPAFVCSWNVWDQTFLTKGEQWTLTSLTWGKLLHFSLGLNLEDEPAHLAYKSWLSSQSCYFLISSHSDRLIFSFCRLVFIQFFTVIGLLVVTKDQNNDYILNTDLKFVYLVFGVHYILCVNKGSEFSF